MELLGTLLDLLRAIRNLPSRMKLSSAADNAELDRKVNGCFWKLFAAGIVLVASVGLLLWWLIP